MLTSGMTNIGAVTRVHLSKHTESYGDCVMIYSAKPDSYDPTDSNDPSLCWLMVLPQYPWSN